MYTIEKLFGFEDATALVVGGTSGLGEVIASALLANGAKVIIASSNADRVSEKTQELTEQYGPNCTGIRVDLGSESSVIELGEATSKQFSGEVNIVVNSAGINVRNRIEDVSLDEFEKIQRVNITGAFLLARTMFPLLKQAKDWARLINVTSIFSSRSFPERTSYSSSKGALLQLTRTLALEWAPHGITVNSISPGPFLTELNKPVLDNPENYRKFCENIPLNRFGEPREIATTALFLAAKTSTYLTGTDVFLDGGWTVR